MSLKEDIDSALIIMGLICAVVGWRGQGRGDGRRHS